jgi:hypothetical protein
MSALLPGPLPAPTHDAYLEDHGDPGSVVVGSPSWGSSLVDMDTLAVMLGLQHSLTEVWKLEGDDADTFFASSWRILELHAGARTADGSLDEGQETASLVPMNAGLPSLALSGHGRLVYVAR